MRYKGNDVSVTVYIRTPVLAPDGREASATWASGGAIAIDIQPMGGTAHARFAEFGPEVSDPLTRIGFLDKDLLTQGSYILYGSQAYQVLGLAPWYSHDEVLLIPFKGTIS
jgi:hypothetical protein